MHNAEHDSLFENFNLLKESLKFNEQRGEITAADTDWLLMRGPMFRDFLDSFNSIFGSGGQIILEGTGRLVGRRFVSNILRMGLHSAEVPTILELLLNQGGWGRASVNLESCNGEVTIENCVIARGIKSTQPACHYLTGYFQGFAEKLFDVKVKCVETACIAKGDSICVFNTQQL